jgi:hypothetical protein
MRRRSSQAIHAMLHSAAMVNNRAAATATHERPWQVAVAIVGAAAGFGVFLIGMGAAVMWVRLDSAGLPAEQGVGVVSKQTLAIVGVHVLLEPLAFGLVLFLLSGYLVWRILGPPPVLSRRRGSLIVVERTDRPRNAKRLFREVGPLVLITCFIVPISWIGLALTAGLVAAVFVTIEGRRWADVYRERGLQLFIVSSIAALTLVAVPAALTAQAEFPSRLQRATLVLEGGAVRSGYFVAETDTTIYVGVEGSLTAYSRERVRAATVSDPPKSSAITLAAVVLWKAIFS